MAIGSMSSCGGPTTARLSIIFVLICALYFTRDFWLPVTPAVPVLHHTTPSKETSDATSDATPETPSIPQDTTIYTPHDEDCKSVPGADKVMVILKTGATEIYEKLPTHFVTLFRCTPHFLIFSDLAQSYSDYTIHDAIEPVSPKYKDSHEDFELYRKMQEYQREGQDMSKLKGDKGWNLDKWKFLPMLHKTYELSPDTIDWFVYIEADTSLSWTNLLQWLKTMDPRKEYYLGAQNVIGDTTFGHGGSGTAISRAAAEKFYNARLDMGAKKFDAKWEKLTGESCCGDEVVARALKAEADIPLTPAWPLFQGEKMNTIDWTATHWCTPPLTMHHVTAIEVDAQWQFHQQWVEDHGWNTPYLYRDLYASLVARHVTKPRKSWNNLSQSTKFIDASQHPGAEQKEGDEWDRLEDWEKESVKSFDACRDVCERKGKDDCVQWMWEPGRCYLDREVRMGNTDEREEDHWMSGWVQERVKGLHEDIEPCTVNWHG
ncbi:hypothetical protein M8818_004691 [Zalaria obscura]|uniref:Uncharacterized protein n=1 Tax=Zalaria obscura TaxID=2024903 RepID=A0ACC3SDL8_9PEZI